MVIMVLGLPGSGKSYFAGKLAQKIDAVYLNSDRIRKEMFEQRTYSEQEKLKVYEELLKKMLEAVRRGDDVVMDATFHKNKTRDPFINNCERNIIFIEVWADEDTIQQRLKKTRPFSEADFEIYKIIKQQWEPLKQPHLQLQSNNDNI